MPVPQKTPQRCGSVFGFEGAEACRHACSAAARASAQARSVLSVSWRLASALAASFNDAM